MVNFKNTVIIMTSNLGSHEILNKSYEEAKGAVKEILKDYFRPEFLNRVDDIIVFKALQKERSRTSRPSCSRASATASRSRSRSR